MRAWPAMRMDSMKYFFLSYFVGWAFDGFTWVIMIMMTKPRDETYCIEHENLNTLISKWVPCW